DGGDYSKAEPLFLRSLKITEQALGPEHPDTATSLNNLGVLYQMMGEYKKAEPYYERALKIREKALGPNNFALVSSIGGLADLYRLERDTPKLNRWPNAPY